ncbi:MAG: hypothetical protein MRQ13_04015 [Candidatus Midichloria sp.]|nr:hypothetical protein [Candidatus Midichloria sp.]
MRRVLVTGGTRGIGYATIAISFKNARYKVCVAYIGRPAEAHKIGKDGISALEWDVSNFEVCKANISKA